MATAVLYSDPENTRDAARSQAGSIVPEKRVKFCCLMVLLTGLLSGVVDGAAAQTATPINISLTNYAFTPNMLTLNAGTTYRFHLTNDGSTSHSFNAPEFFAASQIAPADESRVEDGNVELDRGETVDLTVTPTRAGTYSLDCSHFMHSMLGMHGKIIVQ